VRVNTLLKKYGLMFEKFKFIQPNYTNLSAKFQAIWQQNDLSKAQVNVVISLAKALGCEVEDLID
jgi:hypothetical protein